jgi:hypothetical protein
VSIKKKFATAVATAGLLAGIFGSAFVPAAMAARGDVDDPIARYTLIDEGDVVLNNEDYFIKKSDGSYDTDNKPTKWGFYSDDSDDASASVDATITFTLYSTYVVVDGVREGDAEVTEADLIAESGSSKLKLAWADGDDCTEMETDGLNYFGQTDSAADVEDGYDITDGYSAGDGQYTLCLAADTSTTAVATTVTIKARASDSTGSYVTVATMPVQVLGEIATLTAAIADGYKYIANDNYDLDAKISLIGKDSAGNLLNGGNGEITQFEGLREDVSDWSDNPENWDEEAIEVIGEDQSYDEYVNESIGDDDIDYGYSLFDADNAICTSNDDLEASGDEGKSYTVKFEALDGDVVSNGITFTCTDVYAKVTKVTPEATAGDKDYIEADESDDLSLTATVVDSAGRPLGDGATIGADDVTCDDFDWSLFSGDETLNEDFGGFTDDVVGGECELGTLSPDVSRMGRFSYTLEADESDLSDEGVSKKFALSYLAGGTDDVTISLTRNAAKTIATITFDGGEDAAFSFVYFQIEKSNGTVVEMRRRADADGIAKLVLARRNTTYYVYAFSDASASETDTIKVRFR